MINRSFTPLVCRGAVVAAFASPASAAEITFNILENRTRDVGLRLRL